MHFRTWRHFKISPSKNVFQNWCQYILDILTDEHKQEKILDKQEEIKKIFTIKRDSKRFTQ